MATTRVNFGEWLPDQPGISGAVTEATNVYPLANGYGPTNSAVEFSNAAAEALNSLFVARSSGATTLFAGSTSKLYNFNSTTLNLDDISKTGGYSSSTRWKFAQFGSVVLAANGSNILQSWNLGGSTKFADVSASAPAPRYVTVVRDFVVTAHMANEPNKVQWSDINDETDWVSSAASQADFQVIPIGGDIQGITGGEFGLVLSKKAITRMSYIGSPLFFQFDTISTELGCYEPNSIIQYNGITYFLSDNGFYSCDGQSVVSIGSEKVDNFFWNDVQNSSMSSMSAAVDPLRKLVIWCYKNNTADQVMLIYNWSLRRWSYATTTAQVIAPAASSGVTLEGLDTYGTLETIPFSLDDPSLIGGNLLLAGIVDTKLVKFSGAVAEANVSSGDIEVGPRSVVTLIRPIVDNGSGSATVVSRDNLADVVEYGASTAADAEGRVSLRSAGKYHRIRITPSGDWKIINGFDIDVVGQGNR